MQPLPLSISRALPAPMLPPEPAHPGYPHYLARVHNLWLLRYHLPLAEGVADCYQALCFLWLQQGFPAQVTATLPDLTDLTGASQTATRTRLQHLLQVGLLAAVVTGKRGQASRYTLGPEPAELLAARYPNEACRWQALPAAVSYQNTTPMYVHTYQNLLPNAQKAKPEAVVNRYQILLPNAANDQNLIRMYGHETAQPAQPQSDVNRYQNLLRNTPEEEVIKGTENFNSLKSKTEKAPTPLPPPPEKLTAAQEYEGRKRQNQAAAVAFEQYLAAYEGRNTETVAAWELWKKLPAAAWQEILAFLPAYCLYTSGPRLQFRQSNAKFIRAETWRSADKLQLLKEQYTKTLNQTSPNATAPNNRTGLKKFTNTQRQNSPDVTDYGSLSG